MGIHDIDATVAIEIDRLPPYVVLIPFVESRRARLLRFQRTPSFPAKHGLRERNQRKTTRWWLMQIWHHEHRQRVAIRALEPSERPVRSTIAGEIQQARPRVRAGLTGVVE